MCQKKNTNYWTFHFNIYPKKLKKISNSMGNSTKLQNVIFLFLILESILMTSSWKMRVKGVCLRLEIISSKTVSSSVKKVSS